jgi:GH15 family glucan-1,4-alpha-glucosidase
MVRPLVIGNSSILVTFDRNLVMRDFYYPYVGQWNHIMGQKNNMGFWTEGKFVWIDNPGWERELGYQKDSLVASSRAVNKEMGLAIESVDAVYYAENIYLKRLKVKNLSEREREIRVFFGQDFSIDETEVGDTALFDPRLQAVYHYKKNRYFMASGHTGSERIYQYATGTKRFGAREGTWRDAEDGFLSGNNIAQGSVDSVISFRMTLGGGVEQDVFYWIVAGNRYQEVRTLNNLVLNKGVLCLLEEIGYYWDNWLELARRNFADLPEKVEDVYKLSLLIVRAHLDAHGAVIAAADSDILQTNRDHYCYLWPRDGALAIIALIRAGYGHLAKNFFTFCARALTEDGYLMHKYNPDGTLGSSWHPWLDPRQPPLQEDETALVLLAFLHYYRCFKSIEIAHEYFRSLIQPAADFLASYFKSDLELPMESYDLWEERRGIFTFTVSAVYDGLKAAARIVELFGEKQSAQFYRERAEQIKNGIEKHLYDPRLGRFIRGLVWNRMDNSLKPDPTLESSIMGLFLFRVWPVDDPRLIKTMKDIEEGLWVKTPVGGIARYTNDYYFQRSSDISKAPGNPWFVCTFWLAQWHIARANTLDELAPAKDILNWAAAHTLETGLMAEQLHPETGEPLSVAPLTWSHAAFILAVLDYLEKYAALSGDLCMLPSIFPPVF